MNVEWPVPCPLGTFGPGYGLLDVTECVPCYGGRYCSQYGLAAVESLCDARFYCYDKSVTPVPTTETVGEQGNECEAGGYCPEGSKFPLPCFPGFYGDEVF